MERAISEQVATLDEALALLRQLLSGVAANLRKISYDLPENNGQTALFDVPPWIVITSPEGDLAVHKPDATLAQVRQWRQEGQSHHATQHLRFKRAGEDLDLLNDLDGDLPWFEARAILGERQLALVAGDQT